MSKPIRVIITSTNTWSVVLSRASDLVYLREHPELLQEIITNVDPTEASAVLSVKPDFSGPVREDETVITVTALVAGDKK